MHKILWISRVQRRCNGEAAADKNLPSNRQTLCSRSTFQHIPSALVQMNACGLDSPGPLPPQMMSSLCTLSVANAAVGSARAARDEHNTIAWHPSVPPYDALFEFISCRENKKQVRTSTRWRWYAPVTGSARGSLYPPRQRYSLVLIYVGILTRRSSPRPPRPRANVAGTTSITARSKRAVSNRVTLENSH
jgi:hypothetical protein